MTPNWHPLHAIGESLKCPGCGTEFLLPVEHNGSGLEIVWEYTLNSLVNRVMDQDALPSVLALYHSTKPDTQWPFIPGIELLPEGKSEVQAEFDYLFVKDQELFAGECKIGTELAEKDIKTARLARDLGVKEFSFCTLRNFSDQSSDLIRGLTSELGTDRHAMAIKTLTGKQLLGAELP
jgi:hypothetical protein